MSPSHSSRSRRTQRSRSTPAAVDAARAKRARDHLTGKRRQQRKRLERQRSRAKSSESRAHIRVVLTPVVFALAFSVGIVTASPLSEIFLMRHARLERVAVQGAFALTPLAIAQGAGVETGLPLDTIDPAKIREAISAEPWIESVRALRLPTGTLVISVVERHAVARWQRSPSRDMELIDRRGERFAGATEPGGPLPLVRGEIDSGQSLPAPAIEILDQLQRYVSLTGDPSALTLYLPDPEPAALDEQSGYVLQIGQEGPRALLGDRLLTQRVARLAALLDNEGSGLREARWIDLRYADRAVLRIEPTSG
jgi:cell division septal protein FtsQ